MHTGPYAGAEPGLAILRAKDDVNDDFRTHLLKRNGCVAEDLALRPGARRENILYGSLSDEQRRRRAKDPTTLRAEFWPAAGGVAPQSSGSFRTAMLLRRALPAARQNSARPVPIYEMGSNDR